MLQTEIRERRNRTEAVFLCDDAVIITRLIVLNGVLLTSSSSPDDTWVSLETLLKPSFACGK
jgi:hypothetical protein